MIREIENLELNDILLDVVKSKLLYWNESSYYFQDLYLTGMRSTEPLQIDRWKKDKGKYELTTLKTGLIRTFEPLELSANLRGAIEDKQPPYGHLTYDQLTAEFRRVVKLHPIYSGDKIADTYLFRYNRARQKWKEQSDLLKVMQYFSWQEPKIAMGYITTKLVYDPHRSFLL